jgi:hypothetical protein
MSQADVTLAWREIYGLIASKGTASKKARRMLYSRTDVKKRLQAGKILLLSGETEENGILV